MTTKLKIGLYDDEDDWLNKHEAAVRAGIKDAGVSAEVSPLRKEVARWATQITDGKLTPTDSSPFGDMDLAIIDTDLRRVSIQTSDRLALWLRCYTNVGAIATINPKPPEPDPVFSSRLKPCFGQAWTDQGVFRKDLAEGHVWGKRPTGKHYHPSYWADLSTYGAKLRQQHDAAKDELDHSLRQYLGIPPEAEERFPNTLFTNDIGSFDTSLRDLVHQRLHRDDLQHVKDHDHAIARVATCLIRNWLKTEVIPLQNILTDAPHMVTRYPSLLGGVRSRSKQANQVACGDENLPKLFAFKSMKEAEFRGSPWCGRKLWWHEEVAANQDIPDIADPSSYVLPEIHFMEDVTWFMTGGEEYRIPAATPYGSRFVTKPHNFDRRYEPAGEFLL